MALIDLSHAITDGLITYPGLPAPRLSDYLSREESRGKYTEGTTFQIGRIEMVANTGTYVDAPSHRYEEGPDIGGLRLEALANLEGVVMELGESVPRESQGRAILIRTGWSRHFGKPEYGSGQHPFVSRKLAEQLVDAKPALVGIDSLNIDDTRDGTRAAHSLLLAAGIPIVEHLTALDRLPRSGFRFFAVPPKFVGLGSFPVRAFAIV
jgi:arylformamidase